MLSSWHIIQIVDLYKIIFPLRAYIIDKNIKDTYIQYTYKRCIYSITFKIILWTKYDKLTIGHKCIDNLILIWIQTYIFW